MLLTTGAGAGGVKIGLIVGTWVLILVDRRRSGPLPISWVP